MDFDRLKVKNKSVFFHKIFLQTDVNIKEEVDTKNILHNFYYEVFSRML